MDNQYEILDHPADLKIRAFGKNLPEVFLNMARAMGKQQISGVEDLVFEDEWHEIETKANDLESLLIDWLNETLYQGEIKHKIYLEFEVLNFDEAACNIKTRIRGVNADKKILEIKSATFHDASLKSSDGRWEAQVVFDI